MAEVAGLAMASAAALEQTIKIFKRIRNAKNRHRDLPEVLTQHEAVISGTAALVSAVEEEDELSTEAISRVLGHIQTTSRDLEIFVQRLAGTVGRSAVRDLTHQVFSGSNDETKLAKLVSLLTSHKVDLQGAMTAAQVGIMKVDGARVVDVGQVRRVDERVRQATDGMAGLKIADVLEGIEPDKAGNVTLSGEQIIALARADRRPAKELEPDEKAAFESGKRVQIVKLNVAKKNSLQINAPIGKDMWSDRDVVIVKNNDADEEAVQVNTQIDDPNVFLEAMRIKCGADKDKKKKKKKEKD